MLRFSRSMSYGWALGLLCITAATLVAVQRRHLAASLRSESEDAHRLGDFDAAARFQRNWLTAFGFAQLAQWMQQPFLFRLYASFGFDHSEVVTFFLMTYASSAARNARRDACRPPWQEAGLLPLRRVVHHVHTRKCSTPFVHALTVCHVVDGIVLSLLYTSFESWMVSEHFASCHPQTTCTARSTR